MQAPQSLLTPSWGLSTPRLMSLGCYGLPGVGGTASLKASIPGGLG